MICVLVVAAGATWEPRALGLLNEHAEIVVLKRCVDVDDLLAAATAGQADVAVVGLDAPGLDATAVDHLRRHRIRPVAVISGGPAELDAARLRGARIGIVSLVAEDRLGELADRVTAEHEEPDTMVPGGPRPAGLDAASGSAEVPVPPAVPGGRVIAVWGPAGAPGRTTLATGLAAELARRRVRTVLVDADPYGGAVGQQLGVLDEVSGLLSAARLAGQGLLPERFVSVQRGLGEHLTVVTGLPRPDRWVELRAGAVDHILETARDHGHVVVDTGFCLEDDPAGEYGARPGRNAMTLGALDVADDIVVVGSADPVGLSRLARGLVELRERTHGAPVRVVVNRSRASLGWSEPDIAQMVSGFARLTGLHFLPDDRAATDRALVAGRTLVEVGDTALGRGIAGVVDALLPGSADGAGGRLRRRRGARAPRR